MNISALQIRKDKITQFQNKGIYTIEDLVSFIPRKYYDFTSPDYIMYLEPDEMCCTIATIEDIKLTEKVLQFIVKDDKNWRMAVNFFHMDYLANNFAIGERVLICGVLKNNPYSTFKTMFNPVIFTTDITKNMNIHPVYSAIKGMSANFLEEQMQKALQMMEKEDFLEPILQHKYQITSYSNALKKLHFPKTMQDVEDGKKRLLINDLFLFNYHMKANMEDVNTNTHIQIKTLDKTKALMKSLPYPLTKGDCVTTTGQRDVLNSITMKMMQGKKVNALVQGDVGCGKTLLAILLLTILCENGYQGAIVAPTNLLAKQHYAEIKEKCEPLGFKVGFVSGDLKKKELNEISKQIKNGDIDIVVGTHSVMSDNIQFGNLGISIVDEEHRFGVEQRNKLNRAGVHKVSMSATPIPRSLALSLYGDLIDVETINVMPAGRQKVETFLSLPSENNNIYFHILEELDKGRQAYIVCPLKTESENEKMADVVDVEDEFRNAVKYFSAYGYNVGMVTGSTKAADVVKNEETLEKFRNHEYDVLIATTIIEVGVNVPNATIMLIKNAERFGFAQIHQLRGRVGRGKEKSYCYLMTDNREKFQVFKQTCDGFEIAKEDLKLRGAGSFLGTEQSGNNKYLMLVMANQQLNAEIKADVDAIFADSERLKRYRNIIDISEV